MKFKNFGNSLEIPFTIYADFETLVIPNDDDSKKTKKHVPSGVSCLTVSAFPEFNNQEMFVYTGPDTMAKFFEHHDTQRERIDEILRRNTPMKPLSPEQLRDCALVKTCRNCDTAFDNGLFIRGSRIFSKPNWFRRTLHFETYAPHWGKKQNRLHWNIVRETVDIFISRF